MGMTVVRLTWDLPLGIAALTVHDRVLVSWSTWRSWTAEEMAALLLHEGKHVEQIARWHARAWWLGDVAWWLVYLFCLPAGWNPCRRRWETEAYVAEGFTADEARDILRGAPHWLWA